MISIYEIVETGDPIYESPVRADHAHTKKRSRFSSEESPITINILLDNGSSDI